MSNGELTGNAMRNTDHDDFKSDFELWKVGKESVRWVDEQLCSVWGGIRFLHCPSKRFISFTKENHPKMGWVPGPSDTPGRVIRRDRMETKRLRNKTA